MKKIISNLWFQYIIFILSIILIPNLIRILAILATLYLCGFNLWGSSDCQSPFLVFVQILSILIFASPLLSFLVFYKFGELREQTTSIKLITLGATILSVLIFLSVFTSLLEGGKFYLY